MITYRPHRYSPVCVALSNDGRHIVSCSKDGAIVKYDIEQQKVVGNIAHSSKGANSHRGQVRAVAISGDNKYLASGGDDSLVHIWTFADLQPVKTFKGHRGPITSLVFRAGSNDLYTASVDKSIRSWDLNQMGFVEILLGHAEPIVQIDMLDQPRLVSAGSIERTMHMFKIEHSSQLIFNGMADCESIDTVAMLDNDHYVSGQMDGSLYVWSVFKKKPVCVIKRAHGSSIDAGTSGDTDVNDENAQPRWIVSVAARANSKIIASGSSDGHLRLWRVSDTYKSLVQCGEHNIAGFINDIRFTADGRRLVCAVGQEHRAGRWWTCKEARNSIVIVDLSPEARE